MEFYYKKLNQICIFRNSQIFRATNFQGTLDLNISGSMQETTISQKCSGTTKATFKISKVKTLNPPSPQNQCCESREREKNQKLHIF